MPWRVLDLRDGSAHLCRLVAPVADSGAVGCMQHRKEKRPPGANNNRRAGRPIAGSFGGPNRSCFVRVGGRCR